jgi:hypothetical protein
MRTCRGASLVELLIAMGVTATSACAMLSIVVAGQSLARIQPEQADQQQRARIAAQVIGAELARAGSGLDRGSRAGSLARYFAPIVIPADGGFTIWYLTGAGHATLASSLDPQAVDVALAADPACAPAPSCRFREDATAVLFDDTGCHDVARIERPGPGWLLLRPAVRRCAHRSPRVRCERIASIPRGSWCGATRRPASQSRSSITSARSTLSSWTADGASGLRSALPP